MLRRKWSARRQASRRPIVARTVHGADVVLRAALPLARRVQTLLRAAAPVGVFLMVVGLALTLLKWGPQLFATEGLRGRDQAEDLGRIRAAILAVLAGGLAALGAYYTHRTFGLNRAGQITERFTRAIDQLGNSELDVRLGGIYALERIARDSKDDHPQVVEVLTAYVREHARWKPDRPSADDRRDFEPRATQSHPPATERIATAADRTAQLPTGQAGSEDQEPATDVQAVLSVLGRRDDSRDRPGARLNLAHTDLRGVVLEGKEANLQGARLHGANLQGARLIEANLQGADLIEANLQGAELFGANLLSCGLGGANLRGAGLIRADLRFSGLGGANLQGAKLSQANLQDTIYSDRTQWPEGFDPDSAGAIG